MCLLNRLQVSNLQQLPPNLWTDQWQKGHDMMTWQETSRCTVKPVEPLERLLLFGPACSALEVTVLQERACGSTAPTAESHRRINTFVVRSRKIAEDHATQKTSLENWQKLICFPRLFHSYACHAERCWVSNYMWCIWRRQRALNLPTCAVHLKQLCCKSLEQW